MLACKNKSQKIKPIISSISESIYATGIIKSKNQYQAFANATGIIDKIFVSEGDSVKIGSPILSISSLTQHLNNENAKLSLLFFDFKANQEKLNESKMLIEFSRNKMKHDSILYIRQKNLWHQQIGTKVEFEQKELAFQNSSNAYFSSLVRFHDLKRQLDYNASQSKNNYLISGNIINDFIVRSEIDGLVYSINKKKGELVGPQTPLAVIGDAKKFILEMQIDEYDILKIKKNLLVYVTLDTYKGKVFNAKVSKIIPIMNERNKSFLVESEFIKQPQILYPNISFEANIVIQSKEKALIIPRHFLINDSFVLKSSGNKIKVITGIKDYQQAEIISGLNKNDELLNPEE
jgi:multidrug efflux pump subunit AcrA (membrane-fusion protein)